MDNILFIRSLADIFSNSKILGFLNFSLRIPILFLQLYVLSRVCELKCNLRNPLVVLFICNLPIAIFTLIGGLSDDIFEKFFQTTLFLDNFLTVYTTALFFPLAFFLDRQIFSRSSVKNGLQLSESFSRKISIIFFICFVVTISALIGKNMSFFSFFSNPRELYQFFRMGNGHLWVMSATFLSLSFCFQLYKQIDKLKFAGISAIYYMLFYLLGSKGFVISAFSFSFSLFLLNDRKISFFYLLFLGFFSFSLGLLLLGRSEVSGILGYFDYYKNSALYFNKFVAGEMPLFNGDVFLTSFYGLMPRFLFEDKPIVYGSVLINEVLWPGLAAKTHTPAFSHITILFSDFGFIGILLAPILRHEVLMLFFYGILLKQVRKNGETSSLLELLLYLLIFLPVLTNIEVWISIPFLYFLFLQLPVLEKKFFMKGTRNEK